MRTLNLTIKNVVDIFNAGMRRGELEASEASAFEWGCRASGSAKDELIDALVDALNSQGSTDDFTYSQVAEWMNEDE